MTITYRPKLVPDFTFEEWCDKNNILQGERTSGDLGLAVLGSGGFSTRRTQSKAKTNLLKISKYNELRARYIHDLTYHVVEVPLDLTKESDQAYLRVMEKRDNRKKEIK